MRQWHAIEIFPAFQKFHYNKEVGHLGHWVAAKGFDVTIHTKQKRLQKEPGFLPKIAMHKWPFWPRMLMTLWREAPRTDLLLLFHSHPMNPICSGVLKLRNRKSIAVSKSDMSEVILKLHETNLINYARRFKIWINLLTLDRFIVEQKRICDYLKQRYPRFKHKLLNLPSGFGDRKVPKTKPFEKKGNLILVVGRQGTKQKGTDTTLKVLEQCKRDLSNWKVLLVGDIENEFKPIIAEFYKRNPELKKSVIFNGPSKNRKEMLDLYNRSKLLLMPSRWEGFSNVPAEAAHFGNVIIGTKVGGIWELTDNGRIGAICKFDDITGLTAELRKRLKNSQLLRIESEKSHEFCDRKFLWSSISQRLLKELEF